VLPEPWPAPPKLHTSDGERCKRCLFVVIDRCSRSVHLAVKDDETEKSAIASLRKAAAAFPFRLTHVLADNGCCFSTAFAKACTSLAAQHRHIRPRTPQTKGMVERGPRPHRERGPQHHPFRRHQPSFTCDPALNHATSH